MKKLTSKQQSWLNHITACNESDLNQSEYCRLNDLKPADFYRWKNRLITLGVLSGSNKAMSGHFIPALMDMPTSNRLQINCGDVSVELPSDIEPTKLKQLLAALGVQL